MEFLSPHVSIGADVEEFHLALSLSGLD